MPTNIASKQVIQQAANVDWVSIAVTATPQRILDLLGTAGLHARWGKARIEEIDNAITALSFPVQDARPELILQSLAADTTVRKIAATDAGYIPAVNVSRCWISAAAPATVVVEVLLETVGDPS